MKLKEAAYIGLIIILLALCAQFYYSFRYRPSKQREVKIYYNQDIKANEEVIKLIQDADEFVYFAIYTFTRSDIKDALLAAKYRGVDVRGVVDGSQITRIELQGKTVKELREAGIPIVTQDHLGIMHLKTLVTEKAYVSGSYNWTAAATNLNDEVIEIGTDPDLRQGYQDVVEVLLQKYNPQP
jgi:phosphatidylserine/phosphatidylglycerophosphate/cardiolipin synthase-like enzyme